MSDNTFGERLRQLRDKEGFSQADLAVRAGLPLGRITKLEQGDTNDPRWSTVQALADALGVATDELRTRET